MDKIVIFGTGDVAQVAVYYFSTDAEYDLAAYCVDKDYF